ncbi:CRISPR-associated (Cas) DxTHG family protein [Peptococcaceae bacterium CEB3]|nr:CRISPR-associated (Cas) DxTHG family protein [Peptococcaceae bacterium CEB3]
MEEENLERQGDKGKVLLTSLSPYPRKTRYRLGNQVVEAEQSPLALLLALPVEERPREIIILCTAKVLEEGQLAAVQDRVSALPPVGVPVPKVMPLHIPDGKNEEEIWEILGLVLEKVTPNCRLILDLTHGFRSFSFLFFTAALYLKALRNVEIESAYYGMLESPGDEKPLLDISVILDMIEWFYAVRTFRETGQAGNIVKLLEPFGVRPAGVQGRACQPYDETRKLIKDFEEASRAFDQNLPIEFGRGAAGLYRHLQESQAEHLLAKIPLPKELFSQILTSVEPFRLPSLRGDKTQQVLDRAELDRQARLVDRYFEQGHLNNALGLAREWTVSAAMFEKARGQGLEAVEGKQWLNHKGEEGRFSVEYHLNHLASFLEGKKDILTNKQCWLAERWSFIRDKRNDLYHLGFNKNSVLLNERDTETFFTYWCELRDSLDDLQKWDLDVAQGAQTLLISPLGNSAGLLYTALCKVRPDYLFILASPASVLKLGEIMDKAEWRGSVKSFLLQDPFAGFDEGKERVREMLAELKGHSDVGHLVINLTGGTTVMQLLIQAVAHSKALGGRAVEQVAFVDRRPIADQQGDPYVVGEMIRLSEYTPDEPRAHNPGVTP